MSSRAGGARGQRPLRRARAGARRRPRVDAGQITGLIGPNGAGKTTTFNVITGLQETVSGRVLLDGRDITSLKAHDRARLGIARTFQRLEVFGSLTARENILIAAEIRRSWSHDRSAEPRARGRGDPRPRGDPRGRQRARRRHAHRPRPPRGARPCAGHPPKVLLLDEPASGLDEAESESFADLLVELAGEGMAILLVEHDVQLVMKVCSLIHVLDFGAILAVGTPDEIQQTGRARRLPRVAGGGHA